MAEERYAVLSREVRDEANSMTIECVIVPIARGGGILVEVEALDELGERGASRCRDRRFVSVY
jgi:hypothetical protein